jgi:hypothetical protein
MSQPKTRIATRDMSIQAKAPVRMMRERPVAARSREGPPDSPLEEFEQVYLRNVDVLMGYFGDYPELLAVSGLTLAVIAVAPVCVRRTRRRRDS